MRFALILSLLVLSPSAGCFSSRPTGLPTDLALALRGSPSFELISLDPEWHEPAEPYPADAPREHGYVVLGRTTIADGVVREQLIAELEQAATTPLDGSPACFAPRHLVRVKHGGPVLRTANLFSVLEGLCSDRWRSAEVLFIESNAGGRLR